MWLLPQRPVPGNLPVELYSGVYILGRSAQCDAIIRNATVSRRHGRLTCLSSDTVSLEDLASTNGIFVGDRRVSRCKLEAPCTFRCGTEELQLVTTPPLPVLESSGTEETQRAEAVTLNNLSMPIPLTCAQREVLALLLDGMEEKHVSVRLGKSPHTVHNHVRSIYESCGVHSRAQLFAKLLRRQ